MTSHWPYGGNISENGWKRSGVWRFWVIITLHHFGKLRLLWCHILPLEHWPTFWPKFVCSIVMSILYVANCIMVKLMAHPQLGWHIVCRLTSAGRASRGGARRNVRSDAPNKNNTIKQTTFNVNKRQTIRFVLSQCYALYAAHWLP